MMKLTAGFAIGSVSIISEAIHSGIDLLAAMIAYFSVKKSSEPPDSVHRFGHGKYEAISGIIEAILILIAAIIIIHEAAIKLTGGAEGLEMEYLTAGIAVMLISAVTNWYVSERLMKASKDTESIALEADAWHLRTDVYTSLAIFAGLILIKLTGLKVLDPIFAIAVAMYITKAAFDLTKKAIGDLLDKRLPDHEENRIREILYEHYTEYSGFHELRTRKAGPDRFVDLHLVVSKNLSVNDAHLLSDHLEEDLQMEFPRSSITIHFEPCDENCHSCRSNCKDRKYTREEV